MNEQNNGSQRRKNNGGALGWALAALIIFVLNAAKGLGGAVSRAAVGAVLALAAVGIFAGAVALAVKKSKSAGVTQAAPAPRFSRTPAGGIRPPRSTPDDLDAVLADWTADRDTRRETS